MNYEQKYNEMLDAARYWHDVSEGDIPAVLEEIFPELAESEDDRMRKTIIDFIKNIEEENESYLMFGNTTTTDMIAWLEKQCPKENNANEETNAPTGYGKYVDECLNEASKHFFSEEEDKYSVADLFYAGVRCGQSWLEKQGDNVSGECNDTALGEQLKIWFEKGKCSGIDDVIFHPQKYGLEKQGEQNPTECIKFSNEFENQISRLLASVLNREYEYNESFVKYVAQSLLCYAKNELNPTEWSEEDELKKNAIISLIKEIQRQPLKRLEDWAGYVDWLESIKYRTYPQLKQEWSEEDEIKIKSIIAFLKSPSLCAMDGNKDIIDENVKYLKSIKDRVQPKQEWSEEDEKILDLIIQDYEAASRSFCGHRGKLDWLKALKERYTWKQSSELDETSYRVGIKRVLENPESYGLTKHNWKPSDEQMEVLLSEVTAWRKGCYKQKVLESLYNELKKLKGN